MKKPFITLLCLCLCLCMLVACRTNEWQTIRLTIPKEALADGQLKGLVLNQTMYSCSFDTQQGKTVDAGATVAASIAATLRDIQASQSGALNRTDSPSGPSENTAATEAAALEAKEKALAAKVLEDAERAKADKAAKALEDAKNVDPKAPEAPAPD